MNPVHPPYRRTAYNPTVAPIPLAILGLAILLFVGCDKAPEEHPSTQASSPEEAAAEHAEDTGHAEHAEQAEHWGYGGHNGPADWGALDSQFELCASGSEQSPIDLATPSDQTASGDDELEGVQVTITVAHEETPVELIDNGHTIQVNLVDGSALQVDGSTFGLAQYHFHAPSEHTLNGKQFPMEVHFVHASNDGRLAVIGVLIDAGSHNPAFDSLFAVLPHPPSTQSELLDQDVDLDALIPEGGSFLNYQGSLTTPPCSEGVTWLVRGQPIELSTEQISAFTSLYSHNNRPVQPINDRTLAVLLPEYLEASD